MRTLRLPLLLCWLAASAMAGCVHAGPSTVTNLFDAQRQIDQYIDSGRYQADFAKVAGRAQAYLEQRAKGVTKPALVLDIDETTLSNWPAYKANGWSRIINGDCNLELGPCSIRAWQATGQSKALPSTLALVTKARELGVTVFFISARPHALQAATEKNLRDQGFSFEEVVVLPEGRTFPSATDFKAPVRQRIAGQGFTILVNMGDQESDLRGGFAERTFKLPNPVYYLP